MQLGYAVSFKCGSRNRFKHYKMKSFILLMSVLGCAFAQSYNCTSAGRFRYRDSTCRSYYLCVLYNGAYVKSNYTCPSTMIFDATSQTCSTTATCIEDVCDGLPLTPLFPKIPDPNSSDCTTYIQCLGIIDRYPVLLQCPDGLYFDQNLSPEADCWIAADCT